MFFQLFSPTVQNWIEIIHSHHAELLNPRPQMQQLLEGTRIDVDKQFDQKQGVWTPLAEYTVKEKAKAGSDPRILHESRTGLRLRDAYAKAGEVTSDGILIYSYPDEKPYAKDHQTGVSDNKDKKTKPKMDRHLARRMAMMDKEFLDALERDR